MKHLRFLVAAALCAAAVSCAGAPPADRGIAEKPAPEAGKSAGTKVERPESTGLENAAFAGLPDGVPAYLERLAAAVRNRDAAFLLAQGERDYAGRVRSMVEEKAYLALLYRVGPYSAEGPSGDERPPRLDPSRLRALRFTGWRERGPVVEVRGLLILTEGPPLPCTVSVLWKLREMRVIGREP